MAIELPDFGDDYLPPTFEDALEDEVTPVTFRVEPVAPSDEREQPILEQVVNRDNRDRYEFKLGVTFPEL
jgi:hypothetical protein